ncbi:CDP-glucose 4,6-dehydratase [Brevundimonas sp. PWP3-1b1]|uniref:CDP-glucose 4,6-dehydratase n=1 Tax=unclassified Brevundimonas TaxID=2622653 RepID=UPI003CF94228
MSFWQGKRVLLTGHTGFKGSWTWLWLEKMGAHVSGLSLEPEGDPSLWSRMGRPGGATSIGDIRYAARVFEAFEKARPEIVIHMAAQALVRQSYVDPDATFDTNVMGLVRVLDAARQTSSVRVIVNVTSDKCYENVEQIWPYRETDRFGGSDPYSASKGCAELVTASYQRSFFSDEKGARLASARAGNVIGGGDWSLDRLVPDCVRAFEAGQEVVIRNPASTRPWQHVLEPISGYLLLAQRLYEQEPVAEGWNFGPADNQAWPVVDVVEVLAEAWPSARWRVEGDQSGYHEAGLLRVDASKAAHRLGWFARLDTRKALEWSASWYREVANGRSPVEACLEQIEQYESLSKSSN